ncbi:MAG: SDR family oxidoreductase [Jatrophihabitantaceae bacterium]
MRVFVTGASGWIGSALVPELLAVGHDVLGLARSDRAAHTVAGLGADVHRGSLEDIGSLRSGAEQAEGIVHLGYHHDFSQMLEAAQIDRRAIETFGEVLAGTDAPLVVAAGVLGLGGGRVATERDRPDAALHPRVATGDVVLSLAERGVRTAVVRFAPTVHGPGDQGFIATLVELARRTGVAGYVEDGSNRWPAVHRLDAAQLVRLAVESAPAGSVLHAVDEPGLPTRDIAEAIGRSIGVPAQSIPAARAAEHFGWIGGFFGMDSAASNTLTRELFGWTPTHPGLLADLDAGRYIESSPHSTAGPSVADQDRTR